IFNLIYLKADTLILSLFKSQQEVGMYGAAYRIIEVLSSLPFIFAGLILPILSAAWLTGDKDKYRKILQKSLNITIIAIFPLIIGGWFLADGIISIMAGWQFAGAGIILQILLVAAGLVFVSCLFTHAIIAIDKQRKIIGAYAFTSISSLALYLILIPRYSYYGAAIATVYSELAITIAAIYFVRRYTAFRADLKIVPKVLFSSLAMSLFLFLVSSTFRNSNYGTIALIFLATIVYFVALYLVKGVKKSDVEAILNKNNN
ncbi:MAG: polysaccharide biosynthesis C-terminal domain-containing protein, partial [Candidatus Falkowbacteria bacterium]|nr:polysaccharide biosynthesis C-terminal domain-containing protein [Candidatus Falkowbacteria bacterium]